MTPRTPRDSESIRVAARIRPLLAREDSRRCARALDEQTVQVTSRPGTAPSTFHTDICFDEASTQDDIWQFTQPLVASALDGFNATVFAYGQTGTGKTHTMLGVEMAESGAKESFGNGDRAGWGVIPRTIREIFRHVAATKASGVAHRVWCTYLEIYNERVFDMLAMDVVNRRTGSGLEVREDKSQGIFVPDALKVKCERAGDVFELLWRGARNRAVAATDMNDYSSRSHTVFQVMIERSERGESVSGAVVKRAKLNLVDLAGSERWRPHQISAFTEQRVAEMTAINQSLSALGNCVRALTDPARSHTPFRDSRLTRLLQDSLGGNTRTAFIVTASPAAEAVEETLSTLQFAERAKRVVVHAVVNVGVDDAAKLHHAEGEVTRLRRLLRQAYGAGGGRRGAVAAGQGRAGGGGGGLRGPRGARRCAGVLRCGACTEPHAGAARGAGRVGARAGARSKGRAHRHGAGGVAAARSRRAHRAARDAPRGGAHRAARRAGAAARREQRRRGAAAQARERAQSLPRVAAHAAPARRRFAARGGGNGAGSGRCPAATDDGGAAQDA